MSDAFCHRDGELFVEDVALADIAARFGTPCYVYSRATLRARLAEFHAAFASHPHLVCYAVKANANLAVLQTLAQGGAGFDIVSAGELERVLRAGGKANEVVFSGVGKSRDELRAALTAGIASFNIESFGELEMLSATAVELSTVAPVAIRVNPDIEADTHPYIATGLDEHKFGVPIAEAGRACAAVARLPGVELRGLACHIGSQVMDLAAFGAAARRLAALADTLAADGVSIEHMDLGGGLGLGYGRADNPCVADYANAILEPLRGRPWRVMLEPGRSIAGPAGALVSQVQYLKSNGERRFAVMDAGMNDLLRPALYQAWQPILAVRERADLAAERYDVVGPVCESADFLGLDRELRVAAGDLLAVMDAGAYGFCMSSQYNARPRAAEIMVDGKVTHLVRERETIESLMAGERLITDQV